MLRAANQELDAYAYTVSHDLRSPLTAVILANAMLKNLLEDVDQDSVREVVEETSGSIDRNLGKVYALINDLLSLAEAGAKAVNVENLDVADVVSHVLDEYAQSIRDGNIEVKKDDDLGRLVANDTQIYQLFSNIISNAILHNDSPHPAVSIRYQGESEGERRFKISDNGPGFPVDMLTTAFEPFQKTGTGTGIGLAIAKKITLQYGGTIRAFNDNGACLEFMLRDFEKVT